VDLAVVLVVIQEQKVQELQVLLAKVMTVVPQRDQEMVAVVAQELQVEMEIVQTAEQQHAQVESALQTTSLERVHITAVAVALQEIREVV
jgi:hypothetical protein